jgi:hypothetical protein
MADETPRTLIRALAKGTDEENKKKNVKPSVNATGGGVSLPTGAVVAGTSKRQRGGGGIITMVENEETPRQLIQQLAQGLSTGSDARAVTTNDEGVEERKKKKTRGQSSFGSETPKDAKALIQGYLNAAKTDSREKESELRKQQRDDEFGQDDWFHSETEEEKGFEEEQVEIEKEGQDVQQLAGAKEGPPKVIVLKKQPQKKGGAKPRAARTPGEIPYLETVTFFKEVLASLPAPNRPTSRALDEAHLALNQYLERSVRDYARLARIDDVPPHYLNKARVEQLLREQGLLIKPLGDEIRRLLDREGADAVLALPISRSRAGRTS